MVIKKQCYSSSSVVTVIVGIVVAAVVVYLLLLYFVAGQFHIMDVTEHKTSRTKKQTFS